MPEKPGQPDSPGPGVCGGLELGRGPLCGVQQSRMPGVPSGTPTSLQDQHAQRPRALRALTKRTCVDARGGVQACQGQGKDEEMLEAAQWPI